jgi:hypothetical protein
LTLQTFDGLHCELERRGYVVNMTKAIRPGFASGFGNIKSNSTLEVRSPNWSADEFVIIRMFFIYGAFEDRRGS